MSDRVVRVAGSALIGVATAVVLLALAIAPFLNPVWVAFAQERAEAGAWTGYSRAELRAATDAILADLVVGPPDFDVVVAGEPVLSPAERAHMGDVRVVFGAFGVVVLVALALVVGAARATRGAAWFWRAVRAGAIGLVVGVVLVGTVGLVAFDAAFEAFHRIFFAGGNWAFDPRTDRLVQLFPMRFWSETSLAVGAVAVALGLGVGALAHRRLRSVAPARAVRPSWEAAR